MGKMGMVADRHPDRGFDWFSLYPLWSVWPLGVELGLVMGLQLRKILSRTSWHLTGPA